MLTRTGAAFVGLNFVRLLSITALLLVLAATLEVMVIDGRLVAAARKEDAEVWDDCEYVPGTDVPTHTWGLFWTQLDRTFVLVLCIICVFSEAMLILVLPMGAEANWGGYCEKAFNYCLPVLGRRSGTGALGGVQMMIGANLLSHYSEGFPLATAWLLFFVGLINFLFGISFKQPAKDYRSFTASRRLAAGSIGWPRRRTVTEDIEKAPKSLAGDVQQVRTLGEAFAHSGADIRAHQELLRAQARQANEKVERDIEARLASEFRGDSKHSAKMGSDRGLSGAFMYDSEQGTTVVIGRPATRAASITSASVSHVVPAQSRRGSHTVASPPYTREPTNYFTDGSPARGPTAALPASSHVAPSVVSSAKGGFKRKSLALAKATRRRLSNSSTVRAGTAGRRSVLWGQGTHTVPSLTRRRLAQQAEKERAQLLRLAAELKLPRSDEHNAAAARWEPVGPTAPSAKSTYSRGDEEALVTSYSPTSTTGFTSHMSLAASPLQELPLPLPCLQDPA
ncbi:hypothetical protein BCV69DRAFT_292755 [Microstroma glucosiphilum]|uniref:Uncharacterized protein n=1 Tax=Pseudomicrostroma glucosiphilum TaxID=1684307 RepID=A0A316UGG5_9BASI|nr:hypothetical protein BCV69DRAFT_292755 [Pseudomicrostroma glucosiphilum]PWN22245.1 hypothetical protein BCV69DRAFT_292755 [Pseudomicrostroma glucosiphilum]